MSNLAAKTNAYLAFCQRGYDRSMSKADLMDGLADIARENGKWKLLLSFVKEQKNSAPKLKKRRKSSAIVTNVLAYNETDH